MTEISLEDVRRWDKDDVLRAHRAEFALPDGVIYLDGNSLGPLPHATRTRLADVVAEEWGTGLIRSWEAGWMDAPARIGNRLATLLGAAPNEVIAADSTSVNLFKLCAAAAGLRPGRTKLLTLADDFPTDRHVLDGLARLVPSLHVETVPPGTPVAGALDADTALLLLCHVHYRSGARHDMAAVNRAARAADVIVVWDLSHSAGAVPVALNADGAEMAAGCGYKFLNGGPGAPAFLYVARHLQAARSPLQGWIGHAEPFGFSDRYVPAAGMTRFLAGTPGILGLAALETGIEVFLAADSGALWQKSIRLFDLFADLATAHCPGLERITPQDPASRGSHIAFRCKNAAKIMQSLIAVGVIGDYRPPDLLRFGLTPLYMRYEDIWQCVENLKTVVFTG